MIVLISLTSMLCSSITALGASGGKSVGNTDISRGGYVSGNFNLTEGEQIYLLIGQQGQSACAEVNYQDHSQGGGGGGGGGGRGYVFYKLFLFMNIACHQDLLSGGVFDLFACVLFSIFWKISFRLLG